ncbi:MAG TPA: ABC transporter permease [Vicinamibacterales bacterium]|nr:ABC transporter permease [Vicinamibacterales bacterium]
MTETFRQDVRNAFRVLFRSRGFAFAAVVMLALGIGANTAIFSVLRASSLRGSPLPEPERLTVIWTTPANDPQSLEGARIIEYFAWRDQNQAFDAIGTMLAWSSTVNSERNGEPADRLNGARFSASLFRALAVQPQIGRFFTPDEDKVGFGDGVVVISDRLWRTRFSADPMAVGQTMILDGSPSVIVGVMPAGFGVFDTNADFWLPSSFSPFQVQARGVNRVLTIVGRVKAGLSMGSAQSDIERVAARLAEEDPGPQKGRGIRVQPLEDALYGNLRRILTVLQGAVGFVLLIACANVAGLLLVRATTRQKEVAIRLALGASSSRIVRLFLTESLILSSAGALLGVGLAWMGVRAILAASPQWLSRAQHIELDASVLAFTVAVSIVTGVLFGLVPVLSVSVPSLVTPLRASARAATGARGHRRVQSALVVAQVTLTLVLLVGAGLLIRSFWQLQRVNLGLDSNRVVWFQTRVPANNGFRQVGNQGGSIQLEVSPVPGQVFDRVRERLQEIPGIESVAGTNSPLVSGGMIQAPFRIEGRPMEGGGPGPVAGLAAQTRDPFVNYSLVTADFFKTIRVPVTRGREFTSRDNRDAPPVAIINEAMARRFWPGEDPIGQRVTVTIVSGDQPREIVGIVGDTPASRWDRSIAPGLYVPHLQESLRSRVPYGQSRVNIWFIARINQPLSAIVPELRRAVAEVDASLPVTQVEMMDTFFARQVDAPRDSMVLVGIFGAVALLLAVCGIYAMVAYGVVQRTHEIGIRMALGARRSEVLGLVMRQSSILTVVGLVLGVVVATTVTKYLNSLLFELTPLDATTFFAMPVLFATIAAVASYVPARRATKLDPQTVLRSE